MQRLNRSLLAAKGDSDLPKAHILVLFLQAATSKELFQRLNESFHDTPFQIVWADGVRYWPTFDFTNNIQLQQFLNGTFATEQHVEPISEYVTDSNFLDVDCNTTCISPWYRQLAGVIKVGDDDSF
jgi:hypothetical protein